MNEADRTRMETYGISCIPRDIFYYKNFKYDRLDDAIRYAHIDTAVRKLRTEQERHT